MGIIYEISFENEKYRYVGSTKKSLERRIYQHIGELNRNVHINKIMQNVYNKHKESMIYKVIEDKIPLELLIQREQVYIDKLEYNLNICKIANIPPTHYKRLSLYNLYGNLIKVFETREEASKFIGVCKDTVGKYKNTVCLKDYYVCDNDLYSESFIEIPVRRVGKYDLDGNLVKIYNEPTQAMKEIGKPNTHVFAVLRNKQKTCFGYTYRYIDNKIIDKIKI